DLVSTHLVPSLADIPRRAELSTGGPAGGAERNRWALSGFIATLWGDAMPPRQRRRAQLMAVILVLVLGAASGAGGVLLIRQASVSAATGNLAPTTPATSVPTAGPGAVPSATVEHTPTGAPTRVPSPSATPLLTPTMVVSASPLQATPLQNPN